MKKTGSAKRSNTALIQSFLAGAGWPAPVLEFEFAAPVRAWKFDLAWPDLMLAFEIDGGAFAGGRHTTGIGFQTDLEKFAEAAIRGWMVIRATPNHIRNRIAAGWLERAFIVKGVKRNEF